MIVINMDVSDIMCRTRFWNNHYLVGLKSKYFASKIKHKSLGSRLSKDIYTGKVILAKVTYV